MIYILQIESPMGLLGYLNMLKKSQSDSTLYTIIFLVQKIKIQGIQHFEPSCGALAPGPSHGVTGSGLLLGKMMQADGDPLVNVYIANWKIAIEIVSFPRKNCDFP